METFIQRAYRVYKTETNVTYCYDESLVKKIPKSNVRIYEPVKVEAEIEKPKFPPVECPYCKEMVPNNGGAQFAHLKKHVRELVAKKVLTDIQANNIKSTKLSQEMIELFKGQWK